MPHHKTDPDSFNWNYAWMSAIRRNTSHDYNVRSEEERWDQLAPIYLKWMNIDDYPSKLLNRIYFNLEWRVLDIGSGTGDITIPAAMRSKQVTALELSGNMIEILKKTAYMRRLGNIRYIHSSWDKITIGLEITPHEIVLASRFITRSEDIQHALLKMKEAASRYAYVTVWGGGDKGLYRELREILGHSYEDIPEYLYLFNILHQIGVRPNVEHLECQNRAIYSDIEEAVLCFQTLFGPLKREEEGIARIFFKDRLKVREDGRLEALPRNTIWSLFSWKTE